MTKPENIYVAIKAGRRLPLNISDGTIGKISRPSSSEA